jgi:hypothetical protein
MLDAVVDRLELVEAVAVRQLAERDAAIADLRSLVGVQAAQLSQLADARAEDKQRIADLEKRSVEIETASGRVEDAHARCDMIVGRIVTLESADPPIAVEVVDDIGRRLSIMEEGVEGVRVAVQAVAVDAERTVVSTQQRIDDITNRVVTLESADPPIAVEVVDDIGRRLSIMEEGVEGVRVAVQAVAVDIDRLTKRDDKVQTTVDAVSERIATVDRRMKTTLSQLPKRLLVDRNGDLVAINGEGDATVVGQVAGRDGKDGVSVREVRVEAGRLIVRTTDDRRIDVGEWPSALEPPPDLPKTVKPRKRVA